LTKKIKIIEYNYTGDKMKKLIFTTIIVLIIPVLTIIVLKPEKIKEKKYNKENNQIVRVKRSKTNEIQKIPLEKYLIGVLAGEMPVSYDIEALKAQAVAARTYTINKIEQNKNKEYDVIDTTDDQVYKDEEELKIAWKENYQANNNKILEAIKETRGEYLTYDGKPIHAFFFSTSSGNTENCKDVFGENLPYLVSVSSIWDESSPSYKNTTTYTKQEFLEKLGIPYNENINIEIERNETNSIKNITINNKTIKGTEFRFKLGLRSTNLEIEQNNNITITSKGYGHGVGMSQYGAKELANLGYKYDEILKYYYQGIEFKKI
jgi:stage II sporulation protein D